MIDNFVTKFTNLGLLENTLIGAKIDITLGEGIKTTRIDHKQTNLD